MTWGETAATQVYMKEEMSKKSRYCLDNQAEKAKLASKARLCFKTPMQIVCAAMRKLLHRQSASVFCLSFSIVWQTL